MGPRATARALGLLHTRRPHTLCVATEHVRETKKSPFFFADFFLIAGIASASTMVARSGVVLLVAGSLGVSYAQDEYITLLGYGNHDVSKHSRPRPCSVHSPIPQCPSFRSCG